MLLQHKSKINLKIKSPHSIQKHQAGVWTTALHLGQPKVNPLTPLCSKFGKIIDQKKKFGKIYLKVTIILYTQKSYYNLLFIIKNKNVIRINIEIICPLHATLES